MAMFSVPAEHTLPVSPKAWKQIPNITWEVANIYNVGFESQMLNSKLTLNADFFYQRRSEYPCITEMHLYPSSPVSSCRMKIMASWTAADLRWYSGMATEQANSPIQSIAISPSQGTRSSNLMSRRECCLAAAHKKSPRVTTSIQCH